MRAIIQRVSSASVKVDNETVSQISKGLMVLVGIGTGNLNLRVFNDPADDNKMWKASVKEIDGDILCVSQFTLLGNTTKGNKPDFHRAMPSEASRIFYGTFLESLGKAYKPDKIKDGKFGAMMSVSLCNEGPVTFTIDSRKFEYVDQPGSGASTPKGKGAKAQGVALAKAATAVAPLEGAKDASEGTKKMDATSG
ncbi:D-Tyr tRNAtyr deacylase-like domain-containing protein [Schizophyllum fasciatum]